MAKPPILLMSILALGSLPLWGQVQPIPLPGGDLIAPFGLFNQFLPGSGAGFDGLNADPNGITNFNGQLAMGYTLGTATDNAGNAYAVITDVRVYQGEYVGGVAKFGAGGTKSAHAHGTFVEIWVDLWDVGLTTQLHDFNPGITPNGVFWIVQVPDSAVQISGDTVIVTLQNVTVVDQLQFPGGTGTAPVTLNFTATYTKSGNSREVKPKSHDPLNPFNWEGKMWSATNSGSFSLAYNDGSFSAQGTFDSSGFFGEIGTQRNGSFVENSDVASGVSSQGEEQNLRPEVARTSSKVPTSKNPIRLKGHVLQAPSS